MDGGSQCKNASEPLTYTVMNEPWSEGAVLSSELESPETFVLLFSYSIVEINEDKDF